MLFVLIDFCCYDKQFDQKQLDRRKYLCHISILGNILLLKEVKREIQAGAVMSNIEKSCLLTFAPASFLMQPEIPQSTVG